jgi:hypothetical protein
MIWQCLNFVLNYYSYTFDLRGLHLDNKPVTNLTMIYKLNELFLYDMVYLTDIII